MPIQKRPVEQRVRVQRASRPAPQQPVYEAEVDEENQDIADVLGASPSRSGHYSGIQPEDVPYTTSQQNVIKRRPVNPIGLTRSADINATKSTRRPTVDVDDGDHDSVWPERPPSSAHRYTVGQDVVTEKSRVPLRTAAQPATRPGTRAVARIQESQQSLGWVQEPRMKPLRRGHHPITYVGIIAFGFLLAIVLIVYVLPSIGNELLNLQYGYPRTSQADMNVGHGGVSHFVSVNLHGTIQITENDGEKAVQYHFFVTGNDAANYPGVLTFVKNSKTHLWDMEVDVNGSKMLFTNTGKAFTTPK